MPRCRPRCRCSDSTYVFHSGAAASCFSSPCFQLGVYLTSLEGFGNPFYLKMSNRLKGAIFQRGDEKRLK